MKTLNSKSLRKTLGKYSTGVTVVTSTDNDGNPIGIPIRIQRCLNPRQPLTTNCLDIGLWELVVKELNNQQPGNPLQPSLFPGPDN